ncbi:substrate-binding domain-containing protein [Terrarubrum flagellatum]|uniref:substrate-binding domain-containing protein n=1 Tax=Terrirubrum flagellatum TaxID=2895980 RepID=UPI003144F2F1
MSLKVLATSLGLSKTTVSRALDGYEDVSAATRERVRAAARAMNYAPNPIARRLSRGSAEAVALVVPAGPGHFYEPVMTQMLAGLGETLSEAGFQLLLMTARPGEEEERTYRRLVSSRIADAAIVVRTRVDDPRIRWLSENRFPFVTLGRSEHRQPFAFIDGDAETAFREATAAFIRHGHRRVALIASPRQYSFARIRTAGWLAAMNAAGLAVDAFTEAEPTEEGGLLAARALIEMRPLPTAILCMTDRIAIGAMSALRAAGLKPGVDVAIMGHDNIPASPYTDPPLATMDLPGADVGHGLGEKALALINGADAASLSEIRPVSLIWRESAGGVT